MRMHEILLEFNEQRIIKDFGKKLLDHFDDDITSSGYHVENGDIANAFNMSDDQKIKSVVRSLSELDPTPNKEFVFWLALNYSREFRVGPMIAYGINRWEDISTRAIPDLLKFKALLKKPNLNPPLPVRDINQIKALIQLDEIVDAYPDETAQSNTKQDRAMEQGFYNSNPLEAELVYDDADIKVVIPFTEAASKFFGRNTKWCTAAKHDNRFMYYSTKGDLYIVLVKKENARYQFHFQSEQFMDERDESINPNELADKYPILWKIFTPIAEKNNSIILNEHPSEKVQEFVIAGRPHKLKYLKNPSEKIQLLAVGINGYVISEIKNPSEAVQIAAIRTNVFSYQNIKNPCQAATKLYGKMMGWKE